MSNKSLVSNGQITSLGAMLREKGVPRTKLQRALDTGLVQKFMDQIKADGAVSPLTAPGPVRTIWVANCDTTPHNVLDFQDKEGLFPPLVRENVTGLELILLSLPIGDEGAWDQALEWAEAVGLERTHPSEVLPLQGYTTLNAQFGVEYLHVASTTCATDATGSARVGSVVWYDLSLRVERRLEWVDHYNQSLAEDDGEIRDRVSEVWFAFRRK